ncbi:MAG: ATP-dependent metallopeptidase FtsH/Yme1/Tma family protein, partial [Actinomyces sp.]|nr:ATP-dependent metallopeptidase FtsH/Yme1/Tma family protein [Actinomyces sp.]
MADNTQNKKKRNTWGLVAIPLLPLVIALFFLWTWFQPQSVDTSEGLQVLKEAQIERVVVNDGTQQVNLVLKDPWTHKSTGVNDRERSLGRNISFTYARTQSQSIVESVEKANPGKGWDAYYPQSSFLSSTLAAILPLALVMGLFWFFMSRMGGSQMMGPFGQSRTKDFNQERPNVTFADVAGE